MAPAWPPAKSPTYIIFDSAPPPSPPPPPPPVVAVVAAVVVAVDSFLKRLIRVGRDPPPYINCQYK